MTDTTLRGRWREALAMTAALAVAAGTLIAGESSAVAEEPNPLPVFEFGGVLTDKETLDYNPTNEFIFPSIFHAGEHFEDPLGEWYLYYAPHDDPGGISMMYADTLAGPWTEYADNPLIANEWPPHYDRVPHVSTPDAFWHPEEQQLFLYFHGDNGTTRYATSHDGVTFEYGDVAVTNADGGPGTTETSYARVFEHPDPSTGWKYGMFYMDNTQPNIRRIRLAESADAREWHVRPDPIVRPGPVEGQNVSSANLWEWDGQLYVIYHASSGKIHARAVNPALTEVGEPLTLHESSGVGPDVGRVAAPDIATDETGTYLFYESGDRLGGTIAYAKLDPDAVRPGQGGPDPDPLREQCQGAGSDEFEGSELDRDVWPTIVREQGARHTLEGGALVLPTYGAGVNGVPLIQQSAPEGDWEVTTQLTVDPTERFQQAGILLYRDDANYAKWDLTFGSNGQRLEFIWRTNGVDRNTASDSVAPPAELGDTFWLRLTSDGNAARAFLSTDGQTFTQYGRPVDLRALAPTAIGPYAMRGATTAGELGARFDWFRWTPTDVEREECARPDDDEVAVPGQAVLSSTSGWQHGLHDGNHQVRMNLWWGSNASIFRLFENGQLIATVPLSPATPAAQSASVDIAGRANGTYLYTGELVNSQGTTATKPVTVTVKDAAPGKPTLSSDNWDRNGSFQLTADLWWGTNATAWRILEGQTVVGEGELVAATPSAQRATLDLTGISPGTHSYVVEFSNAAGTTASAPVRVVVAP